MKADGFETAAAVSREFNAIMKKNLSWQTISRRLAEHDLHARTPAVEPLLSSKNKNIFMHIHEVQCPLSQGHDSHELFQGRDWPAQSPDLNPIENV